jgi:hypothetical protein
LSLAVVSLIFSRPALSEPLDSFQCHRVKPTKGSEKLEPIPHLTLTDQFESRAFAVLRPLLLCNPAQVGATAINDAVTHLKGYQLKPFRNICIATAPANVGRECKNERDCGGTPRETDFCQNAPRHTKLTGIRVVNQFGDIPVDTVKPETLLVPTATCRDTPGEPCPDPLPKPDPALPSVDHYECYAMKLSASEEKFPKDLRARVVDQSASRRSRTFRSPRRCVTPSIKTARGSKTSMPT